MTSFKNKVALHFLFAFSVFNSAGTQTQERCATPDGKQGKCIAPKDCQPIVDFLQNAAKPIPRATILKLMQYTCAYRENVTMVCCPQNPISFKETDDLSNITNHKNFGLMPPDCGLIDVGDKIRNGEDAGLLEFPWMALLSYNTSKGLKFNCGGSIINERYILTAAHCIVGTPDPLTGARVGEYDISTEVDCKDDQCLPAVQDLSIEKIIYHPEYNITLFANDIGLIRVSRINLTVDNAKPVCLPLTEELRNQKFRIATVTGWGNTGPYGRRANILQKVQLPVHNLTTCITAYEKLGITFTENQVCAGGTEKKDSCGGDSGGPLHSPAHFDGDDRYVQQGIVSIGHAYCGLVGYPSIFTRVAPYLKWILDSIEP